MLYRGYACDVTADTPTEWQCKRTVCVLPNTQTHILNGKELRLTAPIEVTKIYLLIGICYKPPKAAENEASGSQQFTETTNARETWICSGSLIFG